MSTYLVGYIVHGELREHKMLEADSMNHLKDQLNVWHSDTPLEGEDGFRYITNGLHWVAAGYGPDPFLQGYTTMRAPAHFNPPFFHILTSNG